MDPSRCVRVSACAASLAAFLLLQVALQAQGAGPASTPATSSARRVPTADALARARTQVPPAYPAIARAAGVEGLVLLDVLVSDEGVPIEVLVLRGNPMLDLAALDAVRQWRFVPAVDEQNRPIQMRATIPVWFGDPLDLKAAAEAMSRYDRLASECETQMKAGRFVVAVPLCDGALDVARATRVFLGDRWEAIRIAGRGRWLAGRPADALPLFQERYRALRPFPTATKERASAAFDLAGVYRDLNQTSEANDHFKRAIDDYERLAKLASDTLRKNRNALESRAPSSGATDHAAAVADLSEALTQYAAFLRQIGKAKDAAKVDQQLAKLTGSPPISQPSGER